VAKLSSVRTNSLLGSGRSIAILVAACAIVCSGPAAADLVANGSFELGTFTGGNSLAQQIQPGDSGLSSWTVIDAPVTWYASGWNDNPQQIALTPRTGNFGINLADGSVRTVRVSETINLLPFSSINSASGLATTTPTMVLQESTSISPTERPIRSCCRRA
jgi:hypothetical protein